MSGPARRISSAGREVNRRLGDWATGRFGFPQLPSCPIASLPICPLPAARCRPVLPLQPIVLLPPDGHEPHRVSGHHRGRRILGGIEQRNGRPADQAPAPGRLRRVGPGLAPADPHRPAGCLGPRRRKSRRVELLRQPAQVGEPRREADHVNVIRRLAVQPDHLGLAELGVLRHERKIGAEFASVTGGQPSRPSAGAVDSDPGRSARFRSGPAAPRRRFSPGRTAPPASGTWGPLPADRESCAAVQRERERPHLIIDVDVHLRTELDHHPRSPAGRNRAVIAPSLPFSSPCARGPRTNATGVSSTIPSAKSASSFRPPSPAPARPRTVGRPWESRPPGKMPIRVGIREGVSSPMHFFNCC